MYPELGLKSSRASQMPKNASSLGAKTTQRREEWHWGQGLNMAVSSLLYTSTHKSSSACQRCPPFLQHLD